MISNATIEGIWRYDLERDSRGGLFRGEEKHATFLMLNPSTADGLDDDPTIRKCIGFTKRWGFDRFFVVNLFAFRATKPDDLARAASVGIDIVGPRNDEFIRQHCQSAERVVCAWGGWSHKQLMPSRVDAVLKTLVSLGIKPWCFGRTAGNNQPLHPLMLAYTTDVRPLL